MTGFLVKSLPMVGATAGAMRPTVWGRPEYGQEGVHLRGGIAGGNE